MSNSQKKGDLETYAIGAGLYYLFVLIFLNYPSWIISLGWYQVLKTGAFNESEEFDCLLWSIGIFIVGVIITSILAHMNKWRLLVLIYGVTLFPFLCQLKWQLTYPSYSPYPLPDVNWLPFF